MRSPAAGASLFCVSSRVAVAPLSPPRPGWGGCRGRRQSSCPPGRLAGPCAPVSPGPPGGGQIEKSKPLGDNGIWLPLISAGEGMDFCCPSGRARRSARRRMVRGAAPLPCRGCSLALFLLIHWCSLSALGSISRKQRIQLSGSRLFCTGIY